MSEDPNAAAVGFDVTALSVAQMRGAGIAVGGSKIVTVTRQDEAWGTHSEYDAARPGDEAVARQYARSMARDYLERRFLAVGCPRCDAKPGDHCGQKLGIYSHAERRDAAVAAGLATLRGMRLERSFPCLGTYRKAEMNGPVAIIQCDVCGDLLGVPPERAEREAEDSEAEAEAAQAKWGDSDIPL